MKSVTPDHRSKDGKTPMHVLLLENPLDFITEDHLRLRTMCAKLDALTRNPSVDVTAAASMIEYLRTDLPLLLADEDEDLMPRVLLRAEADDELPKLARRLHQERCAISNLLGVVTSGLAALARPTPMSDQLRKAMRDLARAARRHLILENAVLLPLARTRLTQDDLDALRSHMLQRRKLDDPLTH